MPNNTLRGRQLIKILQESKDVLNGLNKILKEQQIFSLFE